jgi:hypothetical protein
MENTMKKKKSHAFGKDCYLLGKDTNGDLLWLEAAQWDCGWYWGFGYVEVYTNQANPACARDIASHTHLDSILWTQYEDVLTRERRYLHHINEALTESVLTELESWQFSDLMKSFFTLRKAADVLTRGGSHLSSQGEMPYLKQPNLANEINGEILPKLFEDVYKILTP